MTFGLSTSSAFADCPADLNHDNRVDGGDLGILLNDWNSVSAPQFDLNHDGTINGADLALLIGHWGPCGFGANQGITLVIDPTNLNLPTGCSAWVAGYANVNGGGGVDHNLPFKALKASTSTTNAASFEEQTAGALQMIQIYGGNVHGTTTISTGTSEMDGGQLQIFVSPIGTAPTGPSANWGTSAQTVTVVQIISPPFSTEETFVPFDIVEFTYKPGSTSTFDVSGVNCFVVPMTMTPQQQNPSLGSVGIQPIQLNPDPTYTNISRQMIGTAYTQFMTNDLQGGPEFQRLLYGPSVPQPADPCYATAPSAPDNQFFAIVNPWFWINQNNTCDPHTSFWNNYWNLVLDEFFKDGNKLKINVGGTVEYTGTCAQDPENSNVLTYTFQNEAAIPPAYVMNSACPGVSTLLKLPRPSSSVLPGGPYVSQAAALLFGNTADIFPCKKFPDQFGGQIIDAILEAFGRGVALDGLNPLPLPILSATSTHFQPATPIANPRGIAKITTNGTLGMPLGLQSSKVTIAAVGVPNYNGIKPTADDDAYRLNVTSANEFTFAYDIPTSDQISSVSPATTGPGAVVKLQRAPSPAITVGEVVYIQTNNAYPGQYRVTGTVDSTNFIIDAPARGTQAGGIVRRLWSQAGPGGTVALVGASSVAWNNFNNWYAPGNPTHTPQAYNTYSKFLHYSTINGTDSRLTSPRGTPIFIDNKAYGFSLDETPVGPYSGGVVSPKFEESILDGSTINLTLSPWRFTPINP
ncbi:MAG: hypothetical protein RIR77_617 [Planctomycetota bacterium]